MPDDEPLRPGLMSSRRLVRLLIAAAVTFAVALVLYLVFLHGSNAGL